jgi:tetratricopeptide (TPR) repeat protein
MALVLPRVRTCIFENWNKTTKTGSNDPIVSIRLLFNPDGTLSNEPTIIRPAPTPAFSRLADTALRAIHKCVPLKGMPPETYYVWKEVVLHFGTNKAGGAIGKALAHALRASQYESAGRFDRAIADYSKAIEMVPHDASYYNYRAWAYFKAGKAARGLPDAKKALELQPNYARALDTRGSIFEALGRRDEAIADFRRALSLGANDPEVQASGKEALKRLGAEP